MNRTILDNLASEMSVRSLGREDIFQELRDRGFSPTEAIYIASRVLGLSLAEAKTAIYESAAWRDQHAYWNQIQSGLEG
ncbi:hypothetical protein E2C11_06595 [Streptomyces lavendulae]|nr:hypothetical protein [Streptomyces lavendulae]TXJ84252.1 hypothetical protein E2C11_06595 [Streptomyces lavendulae]